MSDLITEYARQCVASAELAGMTAERDALRAELAAANETMHAALRLVADLRHALGDALRGEALDVAVDALINAQTQPPEADHFADASKMVPDGWLPIETAPRDSKPVLVFEPGQSGGIFKAHLGRMMNRKDEWITHGSLHKLRPTHYMPLPQPPGAPA